MGSRLVLILLLSFAPLASASIKKAPSFKEIQSLKREVATKGKELQSLKKSMTALEKELSERNQKLVKLFTLKRNVEVKINQLSIDLEKQSEDVAAGRRQTTRVLRAAIVSELSKTNDPALLLGQKYLLEGLRQKNQELEESARELSKLKESLTGLSQRFNEYAKLEEQLTQLLSDLESTKNQRAGEYVEVLSLKREKEGKLSQFQAQFLASKKGDEVRKKVGMLFSSPVKKYNSISYKDKGVTFINPPTEVVDVNASGDGKIVYSGDLSNYGNVIMIDHGNETRSVILGKFTAMVEKGDQVKAGQKVARTLSAARGGQGKVYFEVRIKNQIQNTVLLLNELGTSPNLAASNTL